MNKEKKAEDFLEEYDGIEDIIPKRFSNVGFGSSRDVYDIGNSMVAKVARGQAETYEQNRTEKIRTMIKKGNLIGEKKGSGWYVPKHELLKLLK